MLHNDCTVHSFWKVGEPQVKCNKIILSLLCQNEKYKSHNYHFLNSIHSEYKSHSEKKHYIMSMGTDILIRDTYGFDCQ